MRELLRRWKQRKSDGILRDSSEFMIYGILANLITFLFRKYLAVQHSVVEFGFYTPLLAIVMILIRAFGAFPYIATKHMSELIAGGDRAGAIGYHLALRKVMIRTVAGFLCLLLILFPFLRQAAHFATFAPFVFLLALFVTGLLIAYYLAPLHALQRFRAIGLMQLLNFIIKFAFTFCLFLVFSGGFIAPYTKAMVGQVLGSLLVLGVVFWYLHRFSLLTGGSVGQKVEFKREILPVFILLLVHGLSNYVDEVAAKLVLPSFEAGLYSAIVTVSKSMAFMVVPLAYVLFPKMSSDISYHTTRRIMFKGLILIALLGIAGSVGILLLSDQVLRIFTDAKYHSAGGYLKYFFIASLPHSVFFLFINLFIVKINYKFLLTVAVVLVLQVAAFVFLTDSLRTLILVTGISGLLYCGVSLLFWMRGSPGQASGDLRKG